MKVNKVCFGIKIYWLSILNVKSLAATINESHKKWHIFFFFIIFFLPLLLFWLFTVRAYILVNYILHQISYRIIFFHTCWPVVKLFWKKTGFDGIDSIINGNQIPDSGNQMILVCNSLLEIIIMPFKRSHIPRNRLTLLPIPVSVMACTVSVVNA